MPGGLVLGVTNWFELEGAVFNIEVRTETHSESVKNSSALTLVNDGVVDDDVD